MRQFIQAIKTEDGWWVRGQQVPARKPETSTAWEKIPIPGGKEIYLETQVGMSAQEPAERMLVLHLTCESGVDDAGNFGGFYEAWVVGQRDSEMDKSGLFVIYRWGLDEVKDVISVGKQADLKARMADFEQRWAAEQDPDEAPVQNLQTRMNAVEARVAELTGEEEGSDDVGPQAQTGQEAT